MSLDPRLLDLLACPACGPPTPLGLAEDGLVCGSCGRVYPVRDGGVPVLVVEGCAPPSPP